MQSHVKNTRSLAVANDHATAVWVSFGQINWETIFCGHYTSIFNNCDVIGFQAIEFGEITQNKAITPFKVIQSH